MAKIDQKVTRDVTALAAIELTDQEVRELTPQLEKIVEYFDTLSKVDVTGVLPLMRPFEESHPFRDDVAEEVSLDANGDSVVMKSAPEVEDHGFKVPPIL